jgi:tetraacyldisaccharide 4'-kinase
MQAEMIPPRTLLLPGSALLGAAARVRAWCYRQGLLRQQRLPGVVLSVGNLTVGGTGKTPMVLWLAEQLLAEGKRVGILTRGYRAVPVIEGEGDAARAVERSDEVQMLLGRLGDRVIFGVGANRYGTGRVLARRGVEWFLLDDGFQHLPLARDADIVLIDGSDPFGGGHLLPAGRLREPQRALGRADVVVITRTEKAPEVETVVRRHSPAPIFYAQTGLDGVFEINGTVAGPPAPGAREKRLFAFCAIGNPHAFFADLHRWGFSIAGRVSYRDHHPYSPRDVAEIERRAAESGAEGLITTEKDLFHLPRAQFHALPVFFCRISLRIAEEERLWGAILAAVERRRRKPAR